MAEFTLDCTRPDGQVIQIGDNDNGRFLKLVQTVPEDFLDHRHLVAALNGILCRSDLEAAIADFALESILDVQQTMAQQIAAVIEPELARLELPVEQA